MTLSAAPVSGIEDFVRRTQENERHYLYNRFTLWQRAVTMNIIFGQGYVPIPEIPDGYHLFAKAWYYSTEFPVGSTFIPESTLFPEPKTT